MEIKELFAPVKNDLMAFEKAFSEMLHSNIPLVEKIVRYVASKTGKRLRPALVYLCARLHGQAMPQTLSAALIVEILHTATLVHDDVVDQSNLRRGAPTVNQIWDNKISVLIGDFLFSKTLTSILMMHDHDALAIMAESAKEITEGELLQIERGQDYHMQEAVYFDLINKKTASLFSAACQLGALSVTKAPEALLAMRRYGTSLGVVFQIRDDLLDYMGDSTKLGKPVGNDIRENKITLPLIHALTNAEEEQKIAILSLFSKEMNDAQINRIVEFVRDHGGVDYSYDMARRYADEAKGAIVNYPDSPHKTSLSQLIDFALQREN